MTKKRIAVLVNPKAGTYQNLWDGVGDLLESHARVFKPATFAELDSAIAEICAGRPDIVTLCGGDGTQHLYMTRIVNACRAASVTVPQILILASGTMNDGATALKLNRRPVGDFARDVFGKIDRGEALKVRLFQPMTVNGECAFLYGAGLPVAFLNKYYRDTPRGVVGSMMTIGSVIWSETFIALGLEDNSGWLPKALWTLGIEPSEGWFNTLLKTFGLDDARDWRAKDVPVRLVTDDWNCRFDRCTCVMATVIDQIGMGFKAFPSAMDYQGYFTLRFTDLSLSQIIAFAPALLTGTQVPGVQDYVKREAMIVYDSPVVRMVDGELLEPATQDVLGMGPILEIITG